MDQPFSKNCDVGFVILHKITPASDQFVVFWLRQGVFVSKTCVVLPQNIIIYDYN